MTDFNELFSAAEQISDRRNKVFNQLIEKAENEIIPTFAKVLGSYNIQCVFMGCYTQVIKGTSPQTDPDGDSYYAVAIDLSGHIMDCSKNFMTETFTIEKTYRFKNSHTDEDIPVAKLTKVGVLDLLERINSKITTLNSKYESLNNQAENLLLRKPLSVTADRGILSSKVS